MKLKLIKELAIILRLTQLKPTTNMPKQTKETKQTENTKTTNTTNTTDASDEVENITCAEFISDKNNLKRLYFRAEKPSDESAQIRFYPKYLYDKTKEPTPENLEKYAKNFVLVTNPIKMSRGGIPKFNPKYHTTNPNSLKRGYYYLPKNKDDQNSIEFFNAMQMIDDYMNEQINTKKNEARIICALNSSNKRVKIGGLTYRRMIGTAKPGGSLNMDEDDEGNNNKGKEKKEFIPYDRVKVKFAAEYNEEVKQEDQENITTQLYLPNSEDPSEARTLSEIEKYFSYGCTAQHALMFNKGWIKKTDNECSLSLKSLQIGITELSEFKKSVPMSKQLNKRLFASGSSSTTTQSETKESKETKTTIKAKEVKETKKQVKEQTEEDDDQDQNQEENNDTGDKSEPEDDPENQEQEEQEQEEEVKQTKKNVKVKGKEKSGSSSSSGGKKQKKTAGKNK